MIPFKKQGLTQEELAVKLGVTNQSVSKWESAQCCPDISLIPKLANLFEISIDKLFGQDPKPTANNFDLCAEFPWADDEMLRVIFARGRKILQKTDDINECINIRFPTNCNETTRQYFKIEVFGNTHCDASINGDVVSHGTIECNQINGDIKECKANINCNGNITGNVNAGADISCGGSIGGNVIAGADISCGGSIGGEVNCGNNISCARDINGAVNCGDNIACGANIKGDVYCGGDIECKKIEGSAECQGNIIYKSLL